MSDLHYFCTIFAEKEQYYQINMELPRDPFLKSQYVNMMLKANNMDLKTFCISANIDMISLTTELGRLGMRYDPVKREFRM